MKKSLFAIIILPFFLIFQNCTQPNQIVNSEEITVPSEEETLNYECYPVYDNSGNYLYDECGWY